MSAISPVQPGGVPVISTGPERPGGALPAKVPASGMATFEVSANLAGGAGTSQSEAADNPYARFEAMVVSQLVSTMLASSGDGMFGEGGGMQAFSSVFAGAIGDEVVKHGGIGLAGMIAHARAEPAGE